MAEVQTDAGACQGHESGFAAVVLRVRPDRHADDTADAAGGARRFVDTFREKAVSNDKEPFVVDGATHVDLYDVPQYVDPTADKLATFFSSKL